MPDGTQAKDAVTNFYKAQGKHNRQLNRLHNKAICKWKAQDFAALEATCAGRDNAVAALSHEQLKKHAPHFVKTKQVRAEAA